ncbi:MAG: hypothetical protein V1874_03385 [Spirochaetota bacterium]
MKKVDKTKINIKVDKLGESARKEMFTKFKEAGGEVTEEKEETESISKKINKIGPITGKSKDTDVNIRKDSRIYAKKTLYTSQPKTGKPYSDHKAGFFTTFSQKIAIRFRLYFMDITDFPAANFNNKFFHSFNTEYKIALMGIRLLYMELFGQNEELMYRIMTTLDKINPLYSQLIDKMSGIYNEDEMKNITNKYIGSPQIIQPVGSIEEPILHLFRKIYVLKPHEKNIYAAFQKSIDLHYKLTNKKSSEYNTKRKNLRNDIFIIFDKLFTALYWLFCRYQNKIIPPGSPEIDDILKIKYSKKQSEKSVTQVLPEEESPIKDETEIYIKIAEGEESSAEQEPETTIPEEILKGLQLLKRFNLDNIKDLRSAYDSNISGNLNNNDKILFIYYIFKELDNEYSFLLTTNKIKYKSGYYLPGHINVKEKLLDYYNEIKKCTDLFMEYSNAFELFVKVQKEKLLSADRYIAHTKELSTFVARREQTARAVRFAVLGFINNLSILFKTLMDDINGSREIIENPDDVISFEITADKNKILNNKTILEAITSAYYFANAFAYKLSSQGDLSGSVEFDEKKTDANPPDIKNGNGPSAASPVDSLADISLDSKNTKKKDTDDQSIIDELDDIFSQ